MTLAPSLLPNGRQLGSSELVISHCPLCPVKMSTEFCMTMGDLPDNMGDLPDIMGDLPDTMGDLPVTMG